MILVRFKRLYLKKVLIDFEDKIVSSVSLIKGKVVISLLMLTFELCRLCEILSVCVDVFTGVGIADS